MYQFKLTCIVLSTFLCYGCYFGTVENRNIDPPSPKAYVHTKIPYFTIDGNIIEPDTYTKIHPGEVTVKFDGPVFVTVPKEPLLEVPPEKRNRTALTACLTTLPICPLTMMFLEMAVGKTTPVETKCHRSLNFVADANEKYQIKLVETKNIVPEINIVRLSDNISVAKSLTTCNGIAKNVLNTE